MPRLVRDAAYLCLPCRNRLARLLTDLPYLHHDLVEALTNARRRKPGGGRSNGLNLEDVVVKAREHIAAWLFGWVRIVAEERGLVVPQTEAPDTLTHWLSRHVEWLAHQPYADEVLANLEDTRSEALRARQIVPARRFLLQLPDGRPVACPHRAQGPVQLGRPVPLCQGEVFAVVREDSPLLPSEIECTGSPEHRWAPSSWPAFGRQVRPTLDARAMQLLAKAISA